MGVCVCRGRGGGAGGLRETARARLAAGLAVLRAEANPLAEARAPLQPHRAGPGVFQQAPPPNATLDARRLDPAAAPGPAAAGVRPQDNNQQQQPSSSASTLTVAQRGGHELVVEHGDLELPRDPPDSRVELRQEHLAAQEACAGHTVLAGEGAGCGAGYDQRLRGQTGAGGSRGPGRAGPAAAAAAAAAPPAAALPGAGPASSPPWGRCSAPSGASWCSWRRRSAQTLRTASGSGHQSHA